MLVWNDPINLMSYVTFVFQKVFGYSLEKATALMLDVHHKGRAVRQQRQPGEGRDRRLPTARARPVGDDAEGRLKVRRPPDHSSRAGPIAAEEAGVALRTPAGRAIDPAALSWVATRSGGPGGQHANTSDTAVTVTIEIARCGLPGEVVSRIVAAVGPTVAATSTRSRSQWRNRQAAVRAALERLDEAAASTTRGASPDPPRPRRS